ncbi:hypothetical protein SAMN02745866_04333 [Alteromonadaceae bacterium Bs31]|nr:hypothetical protein SAMN02745866_04333 [Alteromonadaceae bacterium Bs31]
MNSVVFIVLVIFLISVSVVLVTHPVKSRLADMRAYFRIKFNRPTKIHLGGKWSSRRHEKTGELITFRDLDLDSIPKLEYKFCILVQLDSDLSSGVDIESELNTNDDLSVHSVYVAKIEFDSKLQWVMYTVCPRTLRKGLDRINKKYDLFIGECEDASWSEYRFYTGQA